MTDQANMKELGCGRLAAALCKAMGLVDGAPKSDHNKHGRYDYTSTETMIAYCRGALRQAGLCVAPVSESVENRGTPMEATTKRGDVYLREMWTFRFDFLLMHESGETHRMSRVMPAESGPGRPLDKAKAGAQSMALSYLLRDLLLIPRGEREVEVDARDDSDYLPAAPDAPQPAKPNNAGAAARLNDRLKAERVTRDRLNAYLKTIGKPPLPDDVPDDAADAFGALFFGRGGLADFRAWDKANPAEPATSPGGAKDALYERLRDECGISAEDFDAYAKASINQVVRTDSDAAQAEVWFFGDGGGVKQLADYRAWANDNLPAGDAPDDDPIPF